jgi:hypothetical protein
MNDLICRRPDGNQANPATYLFQQQPERRGRRQRVTTRPSRSNRNTGVAAKGSITMTEVYDDYGPVDGGYTPGDDGGYTPADDG